MTVVSVDAVVKNLGLSNWTDETNSSKKSN
jgi:hypothetical protein